MPGKIKYCQVNILASPQIERCIMPGKNKLCQVNILASPPIDGCIMPGKNKLCQVNIWPAHRWMDAKRQEKIIDVR
jgi:hypothetical protein